MILFRNPGLIDLDAVTTMGVSVKNPNAFGYFGTGLKFAVATILRDGGEVFIFRGPLVHKFTQHETEIRGQTFHKVRLDGKDMAITTQLGRNWQPWMVLRELGCNALDEEGGFERVDDDFDVAPTVGADETVVAVRWQKLEEAFNCAGDIFYQYGDRKTIIETTKLQVAEGGSDYLFYRGIRAMKLERPSRFTYNILSEQTLTEDRNIAASYYADAVVRQFWMRCEDQDLIRTAVTTGPGHYEAHLRFDADEYVDLTRQFIDACLDLRDERNDALSPHARQAMLKAIRSGMEEEHYYGGGSHRSRREDNFTRAIEVLSILTEPDHTDGGPRVDWDELQVVTIDDADADNQGSPVFVENERIYVKRSAPQTCSIRELAAALLKAVMLKRWDIDTTTFLSNALLNQHRWTRVERPEPEPEPAPAEDPTLAPVEAPSEAEA